jgi:hypothetical protein
MKRVEAAEKQPKGASTKPKRNIDRLSTMVGKTAGQPLNTGGGGPRNMTADEELWLGTGVARQTVATIEVPAETSPPSRRIRTLPPMGEPMADDFEEAQNDAVDIAAAVCLTALEDFDNYRSHYKNVFYGFFNKARKAL